MGTEGEPQDPIEAYDRLHGDPGKTPPMPKQTEAEAWGTDLNPLRDDPSSGSNLKAVK